MDTIEIIVADTGEADDRKALGRFVGADAILARVPIDALKANLRRLATTITETVNGIETVGRFRLKEVTVQVEVSAAGGVALIGTANVQGKGALSLKFSE